MQLIRAYIYIYVHTLRTIPLADTQDTQNAVLSFLGLEHICVEINLLGTVVIILL